MIRSITRKWYAPSRGISSRGCTPTNRLPREPLISARVAIALTSRRTGPSASTREKVKPKKQHYFDMSKKINLPVEPGDRAFHRATCKHNSYGNCCKRSGWYGPSVHITMGCTPNCGCRRMKIYDTKHGLEKGIEYADFGD